MIHIAIVEDVKAEADLLQGCLEQYRQDNHIVFQLHFFPDADTFLQTDTHTFDIVFMDVDMPGHNGIEASRVLRETNKTIVLLFVTNLAQYAIAGYEVDALDYILKPINYYSFLITTLIISKKPGNTGISRDIRTEFTTDLLLSD